MPEGSSHDIRRAVLTGVYEQNVGLPRSYHGKRRKPGDAPRRRRLGLFGQDGSLALVGVLALVVLLGLARIDLTGVGLQVRQVAAAEAQTAPLVDVSAPSEADIQRERPPVDDSDLAAIARIPVANSTGRYEEMLSRLDVPVAELFDLQAQTIVIDAGHGGRDPGAVGHQGLMEKDVTLDIARRLREKLLAAGPYRVLLTREHDTQIKLRDRVSFATRARADLFVSLHVNSVPESAGAVNYVETYYFGPHTDQRTLALAKEENDHSDYTMGDFREIIDRIGDTVKTEESAHLAAAVHENLFENLKRHSGDLLDAGAKSGPFIVLLGVEAPSVLVEISCISNAQEAIRLSSPEYRDAIASYLETGIIEYLRERNGSDRTNGVITRDVSKQG